MPEFGRFLPTRLATLEQLQEFDHGMNLERDLAGLIVEKDSAVSDDTVGFRVQSKFFAKAVVIIASTVLTRKSAPLRWPLRVPDAALAGAERGQRVGPRTVL